MEWLPGGASMSAPPGQGCDTNVDVQLEARAPDVQAILPGHARPPVRGTLLVS